MLAPFTAALDLAQGAGDDIQNQINQALEELEQIRNTRQVITDSDSLGGCERAILLQSTDILVLR
jgi:hypothetical protein